MEPALGGVSLARAFGTLAEPAAQKKRGQNDKDERGADPEGEVEGHRARRQVMTSGPVRPVCALIWAMCSAAAMTGASATCASA